MHLLWRPTATTSTHSTQDTAYSIQRNATSWEKLLSSLVGFDSATSASASTAAAAAINAINAFNASTASTAADPLNLVQVESNSWAHSSA